jgi:hypothetical protein
MSNHQEPQAEHGPSPVPALVAEDQEQNIEADVRFSVAFFIDLAICVPPPWAYLP